MRAKTQGYLADLDLIPELRAQLITVLNSISFWALVSALAVAAIIITVAMVRGMLPSRSEEQAPAIQKTA